MATKMRVGDVVHVSDPDEGDAGPPRLGVVTEVDGAADRVAGVWIYIDTGRFSVGGHLVTVLWRPDRRIKQSAEKVANHSRPEDAVRDWKRVIVAAWREHGAPTGGVSW